MYPYRKKCQTNFCGRNRRSYERTSLLKKQTNKQTKKTKSRVNCFNGNPCIPSKRELLTLPKVFHSLTIVNNAVMNTGVHASFQISVFTFFSGYIPRSETAGSYGNSMSSL